MMTRRELAQFQIFAAFGNALLMFGQSLGLERAALLSLAGLEERSLADPDGLIGYDVLWTLWAHYAASFPQEPLGLRYASMLSLEQLGLVGYLVLNSTTVREALTRFIRFQRLTDPLMQIAIEERGAQLAITLGYPSEVPRLDELMEMFLGVSHRTTLSRVASGRALREVRFAHARRHPMARYEEYFGVPVRFEQPEYSLIFAREAFDMPCQGAVGPIGDYLERYMEQLTQQLPERVEPSSLSAQVKALLQQRLHDGLCQQADVARALHMSARTLQRRLQGEHVTFAALLAEVRRDRAMQLLTTTASPVYEIAFMLGYQDAPSFYRAFRGWSGGLTPELYRRQAREPG